MDVDRRLPDLVDGAAGSVSGVAAWIRPPTTRLGIGTVLVEPIGPDVEGGLQTAQPADLNLRTGERPIIVTGRQAVFPRTAPWRRIWLFLSPGCGSRTRSCSRRRRPPRRESNITRAFDAGWGGVVTKTIGLHPVANVAGPKTKFLRATPESTQLSMKKRPGTALHSSWNWELISDKTLDWWVPRLGRIKQAYPSHVLVTSIMAGSGSDAELQHWQTLAKACQDEGADALELNLSCPHMDRPDMGSNIGKDPELVSVVTQAVKEVARVPVWAKLTPSTTDIVVEARGAFLGGADAISSTEHVSVAAAHRPRDARVRDERGRAGLERRAGRTRDPAPVDRQDVAAHAGVSRSARSRGSAASPISGTRSTTSCSAAAPCRCAPRRCSITRSARTC